jgi:hypothetical protein
MAAGDPVSWMLIEQGWLVVDSAGDEVGRVEEVLADDSADIFSGLNVLTGVLGTPTYIAAEDVDEIVEGSVRLARAKDELDATSEET